VASHMLGRIQELWFDIEDDYHQSRIKTNFLAIFD
jgi:hypothetical protein